MVRLHRPMKTQMPVLFCRTVAALRRNRMLPLRLPVRRCFLSQVHLSLRCRQEVIFIQILSSRLVTCFSVERKSCLSLRVIFRFHASNCHRQRTHHRALRTLGQRRQLYCVGRGQGRCLHRPYVNAAIRLPQRTVRLRNVSKCQPRPVLHCARVRPVR